MREEEEEKEEEEGKLSSSKGAGKKQGGASVLSSLPNPTKSGNGSSAFENRDSSAHSPVENGHTSSSDDESAAKQEQTHSSKITYKTIYRTSTPSVSSSTASAPAPAPTPTPTPAPLVTSGYGGSYSQSQYEAFMRRSGMLDTANAESTSSIEFMVSLCFVE